MKNTFQKIIFREKKGDQIFFKGQPLHGYG